MRVRYSFGSRHTRNLDNIKKQRGKYPEVMKEVVRISDIVLEILDARYFEEMRNEVVEDDILKKNKKIIYVLNKCDLVDVKEVEKKLSKDMKPFVFVSATTGEGVKKLRDRIKIETKRILGKGELAGEEKDEKYKRVHVGIIGYPNAGKSSIINVISKRGVAKTSKQAGFTKGMQKIRMSENILILDTPGVIPESKYSSYSKNAFSKDTKVGARTYSSVKDPENIVHFLMTPPEPKDPENITKEEEKKIAEAEKTARAIEKYYEIDSVGNSEVLIEELGKNKNFLQKGGRVDIDRTARLVLRDWQEGRIKVP